MACALCIGYPLMSIWRGVWKSHYPQLAAQWSNNGRFTVVGWYGTELAFEELGYAAEANNQAHHLLAFDPYIRESRTWRQLAIDRLDYVLLGAIDAVVGDVSSAWIIARFFCCIAWFLLIYFLIQRLTDYPPLSFLCAAFITGFSYILTFLFRGSLIWNGGIIHVLSHNLWAILSCGRTESVLRLPRPGISYAAIFLATLCLVSASEDHGLLRTCVSGTLGGALAYVHLDVWSSYILASFFFALAVSIRNKKPAWNLWGSFALSTFISLPFLYFNYPPDPDLLLKSGVMFIRRFHLGSLIYLAVFLVGLTKQKNSTALFCACLAAATFVMVNMELINGYRLFPRQWMFFGNIYVFLLLLTFIPQNFKRGARGYYSAAWALIFAVFLQSVSYAAIHYPFQGLPKDYEDALTWLETHTPKDSEVLTINPEIDGLIPAFTHDKVNAALADAIFSDYHVLDNCKRFTTGLKIIGANPGEFFHDCFLARRYGRRGEVATGLQRGEIEISDVFRLIFATTPSNRIPPFIAEAEKNPAVIHPDYLWFGVLEKQYARPHFAQAEKGLWRAVYRNSSVMIYAKIKKNSVVLRRQINQREPAVP